MLIKNAGFIIQFTLAVIAAAGTAWVARTWRQEGIEFVAKQEKLGTIDAARLESEGLKKQLETIEGYDSQGRAERGRILGLANNASKTIEEEGETKKVEKLNASTKAQAVAMDAIGGIRIAASRFDRLAVTASQDDAEAYRTIVAYLTRAAKAQEDMQYLASSIGEGGTCSDGKFRAMNIAARLMNGEYLEHPRTTVWGPRSSSTQSQPPAARQVSAKTQEQLEWDRDMERLRSGQPESFEDRARKNRKLHERIKAIFERTPEQQRQWNIEPSKTK